MSKVNKPRKDLKALAKRVEKLRGNLTQAQFAKLVKVKQNVISRWESGTAEPTGQGYVRLGNISHDYRDKKWFWEQAGMDLGALDNFIDMRMAGEKSAPASAFIEIDSLDEAAKDKVPFASTFLHSPASTRVLRLQHSEPPFGRGDFLLIDTRSTNVLELQEGDLLAVNHGAGPFSVSIGTLRKHLSGVPARGQGVHFTIDQHHGSAQLIAAGKQGAASLEMYIQVLGKVVAWIAATGDDVRFRHWDREGVLATAGHRKAAEEKKK